MWPLPITNKWSSGSCRLIVLKMDRMLTIQNVMCIPTKPHFCIPLGTQHLAEVKFWLPNCFGCYSGHWMCIEWMFMRSGNILSCVAEERIHIFWKSDCKRTESHGTNNILNNSVALNNWALMHLLSMVLPLLKFWSEFYDLIICSNRTFKRASGLIHMTDLCNRTYSFLHDRLQLLHVLLIRPWDKCPVRNTLDMFAYNLKKLFV